MQQYADVANWAKENLVLSGDVDLMDLDAFVEGREHELFAHLRERSPLHFNTEPDGPGFWSLTRYEDIKWAGQNARLFSSAGGTQIQDRRAEGSGTPSLHNMDAPRHLELKRVLADRFNPRGVERHQAERSGLVVDTLLDQALDAGEGDLVELVAKPLPLMVFGTWLGIPSSDLLLVIDWVDILGSLEDPEYVTDPDTGTRARTELFDYFTKLIEERRAAPRDDLISALVTAQPGGAPLRLDELLPYLLLVMFAGNDTTRSLVSWTAVTFSDLPDQWNALCSTPELVPSAIEELLRWSTPIYCMRRTATNDFERHGQHVRTGEKVVLWWPAGNRDPDAFPDPARFDIARSPNKHLSFGWGPHFCLGAHLARLELATLLRRMIERGVQFEVTGDPVRLRSNFVRAIKRLPVRFHG
jgi:cytochrome P450